jgi:pimeloyl-ACP methyl ester carboxylesterase
MDDSASSGGNGGERPVIPGRTATGARAGTGNDAVPVTGAGPPSQAVTGAPVGSPATETALATNLYVETHGSGPDLVLLHGWGLNLRVWDGLIREMENSFRIITVDRPGHGRSAWNPKARTPAEQAWQVHTTL